MRSMEHFETVECLVFTFFGLLRLVSFRIFADQIVVAFLVVGDDVVVVVVVGDDVVVLEGEDEIGVRLGKICSSFFGSLLGFSRQVTFNLKESFRGRSRK